MDSVLKQRGLMVNGCSVWPDDIDGVGGEGEADRYIYVYFLISYDFF